MILLIHSDFIHNNKVLIPCRISDDSLWTRCRWTRLDDALTISRTKVDDDESKANNEITTFHRLDPTRITVNAGLRNCDVEINPVRKEDSGLWGCKLENERLDLNVTTNLIVNSRSVLSISGPVASNGDLLNGTEYPVKCSATGGNPDPVLTAGVYKGGILLRTLDFDRSELMGRTRRADFTYRANVNTDITAEIRCVATQTSQNGEIIYKQHKAVTLERIQHKPYFIKLPGAAAVNLTDAEFELLFEIGANPLPDPEKNEILLISTDERQVFTAEKMEVERISMNAMRIRYNLMPHFSELAEGKYFYHLVVQNKFGRATCKVPVELNYSEDESEAGLSNTTVGIIVAAILGVILAALLIYSAVLYKKRKHRRFQLPSSSSNEKNKEFSNRNSMASFDSGKPLLHNINVIKEIDGRLSINMDEDNNKYDSCFEQANDYQHIYDQVVDERRKGQYLQDEVRSNSSGYDTLEYHRPHNPLMDHYALTSEK